MNRISTPWPSASGTIMPKKKKIPRWSFSQWFLLATVANEYQIQWTDISVWNVTSKFQYLTIIAICLLPLEHTLFWHHSVLVSLFYLKDVSAAGTGLSPLLIFPIVYVSLSWCNSTLLTLSCLFLEASMKPALKRTTCNYPVRRALCVQDFFYCSHRPEILTCFQCYIWLFSTFSPISHIHTKYQSYCSNKIYALLFTGLTT